MSAPMVNVTRYSTILFMDSMVALEGKPLPAQPWDEIDPTGPILILVVPQVNTEIDKRKRDGRLAKKAREFNRLISPAAESAAPVRIAIGPPEVDIAIATCERIDWDALDDLDPDDQDARVVAQILHARGIPPERKLLFSHDVNPIAMAARHSLKCRKMPEHWLAEPEASPNEKEMTKLKGRVKELEATEPDLSAKISFGIESALELYQIHPLNNDEQHELLARILAKNRQVAQSQSGYVHAFADDSDYDEKYQKYRDTIVPRHISTLHRRLETHYNQIPFTLRVENNGHIQAENLVIALRAIGGSLHDRFACYPIFGPSAPKPEYQGLIPRINDLNIRTLRDSFPKQVKRHDIEFVVKPRRRETIEAHCADFRHGRLWKFDGTAHIDPRAGTPFKIQVELTASNLRGKYSQIFELNYTTIEAVPSDLIDLEKNKYHVKIPMAAQFKEALERVDKNWFDFIGDKGEETNGDSK